MHYVPTISAGVSGSETTGTYSPFDEGLSEDIFVKDGNGKLYLGKVWNEVSTVWPDWSHPNVTRYWTNQLRKFHETVPIDGTWLVSWSMYLRIVCVLNSVILMHYCP